VANSDWKITETHRLTRTQFERWFVNRNIEVVVMEACGSAHYWARWLMGLGIEVMPTMAPRVIPTSIDADNSSGNFTSAARNDWRFDDADSMSARATTSPPQMPDIRLQAIPSLLNRSISFLIGERSPYRRLGARASTGLLAFDRRCHTSQHDETACSKGDDE